MCRVNGDETEWVPVTRGEMMDGLTEVFGNLKEGDLVALRCTDALKPHTRVKAIVAAAATEEIRPGYNGHGIIYTTPDAERADLNQPQNRDKPKAF